MGERSGCPGVGSVSGTGKKISQVRTGEWRKQSDLQDIPIHPNTLTGQAPPSLHGPTAPGPARTLALTSENPAPSSKPPPTPSSSDPTVSRHRPPKCSPLWGRTGRPQDARCLSQPVPLPCRDPQCGLCWGLRSLPIIGPSGQRHGGFAGESVPASAGFLPGASGNLALHAHLPGDPGSPSQPGPNGHFLQEEYEEGLEEILEQEEYEDPGVPVPQVEEPEGKPISLSLLGELLSPRQGHLGDLSSPLL